MSVKTVENHENHCNTNMAATHTFEVQANPPTGYQRSK